MKPEQFIREYGVENVKTLIEDFEKDQFAFKSFDPAADCCFDAGLCMGQEKAWWDICIYDLKRLVESLGIVMAIGPVEYTRSVVTNAPADAIGYDTMHEGYFYENNKHYYENLRTFTIDQIKEAIAVHESIYGGGDE